MNQWESSALREVARDNTAITLERRQFNVGMGQTKYPGDFTGDLFRPVIAVTGPVVFEQPQVAIGMVEPKLILRAHWLDLLDATAGIGWKDDDGVWLVHADGHPLYSDRR